MEDCAPMSTPIATDCKLSKDDDTPQIDATLYRSIIGALLYLTATRPDIMQAVGMVARFQSSPKQSHLAAVKRILRYLKGTTDFDLWYPKSSTLIVTAYSDVDWEIVLYLGSVKSNHLYPFLQLKSNILLLLIVVHKFYGSRKP